MECDFELTINFIITLYKLVENTRIETESVSDEIKITISQEPYSLLAELIMQDISIYHIFVT